jgi:hypothetical protein
VDDPAADDRRDDLQTRRQDDEVGSGTDGDPAPITQAEKARRRPRDGPDHLIDGGIREGRRESAMPLTTLPIELTKGV